MSALIVALPPHPASAATDFAYVVTNDGASVTRFGQAQAAVLPAPAHAGGEVVAVVPATMLSWHRIELPRGVTPRSPRLRAVLEGLLEDQLLDEPESLHFALQPGARSEAPAWVATCDREWLRSAVQFLEVTGRPVSRIVPEFAPQEPPALYAMGDPDDARLVAVTGDGVTTLPLSAGALALLPALPEDTACIAEPAVAQLAEQVMQHQPILQQASERWVRAAHSAWDLAQFELSSSGGARALKRLATLWTDVVAAPEWRAARWGAVLLIVGNLVGLNAWAWRERAAIETKREMMQRTLTQTFPDVKVVVDAPVQMEREIGALRQASGATSGRDLEAMLAALTAAVPPQRAITGIDYSSGELRARGLGLGANEQRSATAAMKTRGYKATSNGDVLVVTQELQP